LEAGESVTQTGRYRYLIDDRPVDLSWAVDESYVPSPSTNAG